MNNYVCCLRNASFLLLDDAGLWGIGGNNDQQTSVHVSIPWCPPPVVCVSGLWLVELNNACVLCIGSGSKRQGASEHGSYVIGTNRLGQCHTQQSSVGPWTSALHGTGLSSLWNTGTDQQIYTQTYHSSLLVCLSVPCTVIQTGSSMEFITTLRVLGLNSPAVLGTKNLGPIYSGCLANYILTIFQKSCNVLILQSTKVTVYL